MAKKKNRRKKKWLVLVLLVVFLGAAGAAFGIYENSLVYGTCYVEAGVEVTPQDFLKRPDAEAAFAEDSEPVDIHVPGSYTVKIKTGLFAHKSILYVTDTTAPIAQGQQVELTLGETCGVTDFVPQVSDATEVTFSYRDGEPDFTKIGEQPVPIYVTDAGNNVTEVSASLYISPAVKELTIEAGGGFPAIRDFMLVQGEAKFITDMEATIDATAVGDYEILTEVDGVQGKTVLHIVDTIPPVGTARDVESFCNVTRHAEDFVESVQDMTQVSASFVTEPDLTKVGEQEVRILLTDEGGNTAQLTAKLTLQEDVDTPVITGAKDLTVYQGMSVSYKTGVTVTDDCMEDLQLLVDNSQVDLKTPGDYPLTYTATDAGGHSTQVQVTVHVLKQDYDINEVDRLADEVLAQIITQDMTQYDKCQAIYNWVVRNIGYIDYSDKGNWVQGAWEGLVKKQGDCYVYFATSKELLTRAGIENLDIEKIPTTRRHYWNLVNLGTGWYHFDTTPRVSDHPRIFLWTEDELMAYSAIHYRAFNYDHSLYPEVSNVPYEQSVAEAQQTDTGEQTDAGERTNIPESAVDGEQTEE